MPESRGPALLVEMLERAEAEEAEALAAAAMAEEEAGIAGGEGRRPHTPCPRNLINYDILKASVGDPAPLLYAYQRLYYYLGELSPTPKFLKRKGQSDAEAYAEYEGASLDLFEVHLNDLRFHPGSLEAWLGLTERAWHLYLLYLDHCPEEESDVVRCFEEALTGGEDGGGLALGPFFDLSFFEDLMGDQGAKICSLLEKLGQGHLLESFNPARREEEADAVWASVVTAAYRVFTGRCLQVMDCMFAQRLKLNPRDRDLASKRVEARLRHATMIYMRRYGLPSEKNTEIRKLSLLMPSCMHKQLRRWKKLTPCVTAGGTSRC